MPTFSFAHRRPALTKPMLPLTRVLNDALTQILLQTATDPGHPMISEAYAAASRCLQCRAFPFSTNGRHTTEDTTSSKHGPPGQNAIRSARSRSRTAEPYAHVPRRGSCRDPVLASCDQSLPRLLPTRVATLSVLQEPTPARHPSRHAAAGQAQGSGRARRPALPAGAAHWTEPALPARA